MELTKFLPRVDCTLLDANAKFEDFVNMTREARELKTRAICVPIRAIPVCVSEIDELGKFDAMQPHDLQVCAVVDFPDGNLDTNSRLLLVKQADWLGATELDIVMQIGVFLESDLRLFEKDLSRLAQEREILKNTKRMKLIVETGYLADDQILRTAYYADCYNFYWKASTGRDPKVPIIEKTRHVKLVSSSLFGLKIKAAGGIQTQEDVLMLDEAGADIFGISWKALQEIIRNWK